MCLGSMVEEVTIRINCIVGLYSRINIGFFWFLFLSTDSGFCILMFPVSVPLIMIHFLCHLRMDTSVRCWAVNFRLIVE